MTTLPADPRPRYLDGMLQHIVLFKWKAGTTDAQVKQAFAQAEDLVNGIDGVERITLGRNRGDTDHGFTHALVVNVADEDALTAYLSHPVRQRYITEVLGPIEAERIEVDAPDDAAHRRARPTPAWEWGVAAAGEHGTTRHSASADAAALRLEEKDDDL
jgi:Stress responsive A/B Barrel Domain